MLKQIILFSLFAIYLLFPKSIFAARNIFISSDKASIYGSEEVVVTASISGFTNGEKIYIKGAFFKDGTSNYFGFTKFNDDYIKNNETSTAQKEVTIGSWDLKTNLKADFEDTGYGGRGSYNLKLGYYYQTSSGLSSVNWSSNNSVLNIDAPSPTPTPVSESKSTVSSNKSSTPTPTAFITLKATPTPTKSPIFAKIANEIRSASEYAKFRNSIPEKKEPKTQVLGAETGPDFTAFWILAGLLFVGVSLIWIGIKILKIRNIL